MLCSERFASPKRQGRPESRAGGGKGEARGPSRPFFLPARFGQADAGGLCWKKMGRFHPPGWPLGKLHLGAAGLLHFSQRRGIFPSERGGGLQKFVEPS